MKTLEDFKRAFPGLYSGELIGFSVPPGWVDLVWQLSEQLEPLGVQCIQVKEKFGGLRFYLERYGAGSQALIEAAENKSTRTCQECAAPGSLAQRGMLILTCCDSHLAEADRVQETPYGFEPTEKPKT